MNTYKTITSAVIAVLAVFALALPANAGRQVRVLVMDDLERLSIDFPNTYDVWDDVGGIVRRKPGGGSRISLDKKSRCGRGIRIRADETVININEFSLTGNIDITKGPKGSYRVVNELNLEDYTRAVVGMEMDPGWPIEALKAQAVVARTYALYRMSRPGCDGYDLCATTNSQMFTGGGRFEEGPATAVESTRGLVLSYDGRPAETLYHGSCGGRTEDASEVWDAQQNYLTTVSCGCVPGTPYDQWTRKVKISELESALAGAGLKSRGLKSIAVKKRSPSGRVKELEVGSSGGSFALKGSEFRKIMGYTKLPSTYFVVNSYPGGFMFTGSGSGHGVGMCQWGAKAMAADGSKYYEILAHYYPGLKLASMADGGGAAR